MLLYHLCKGGFNSCSVPMGEYGRDKLELSCHSVLVIYFQCFRSFLLNFDRNKRPLLPHVFCKFKSLSVPP